MRKKRRFDLRRSFRIVKRTEISNSKSEQQNQQVKIMKKLVLYGDSNTYGYDPRGFMGMRYPEDVRWASLIEQKLQGKYEVINEGMNGRPLPDIKWDGQFIDRVVSGLSEDDILIMMLGTNDILLTDRPDSEVAIKKMENILSYTKLTQGSFEFIVIAPVYIGLPDGEMSRYYDESVKMNEEFGNLCVEKNVRFTDAGKWNIPLAYDLAHFSEEGHKIFAEKLMEELDSEVVL